MDSADLQPVVDAVVAEHDVPGALLGVLRDGEVHVAAAGTRNRATGDPMTPGTVFLAGSVTKVWGATLLMTLADEGLLDLDDAVAEHLPELRFGVPGLERHITVRQLLTHTSGLDAGDLIVDLGRGEQSVARYVELMPEVGQLHAPGAFSSYCNAGFVLAGRLAELRTGLGFPEALRQRVVAPLGLTDTVLTPEEAVLRPVAVGHLPSAAGPAAPTRRLMLPEALGPAGATLFTSVADLLGFAQAHLDGGGEVLSAAAAKEMASHQVDLPVPELGGMGLAWFREQRGDGLVLSHTGGSLGGVALLAAVPGRGAVAAFVNSTAAPQALLRLREHAFGLLGLDPWAPPVRTAQPDADAEAFVGRYERYGFTVHLDADGDGLAMRTDVGLGIVREYLTGQPSAVPCQPLDATSFAAGRGQPAGVPLGYLVGEPEQPYLYSGLRLARRTGRTS